MLLNKIQNNTSASVRDFEAACDDLISAKYILADTKISKVLQTIVVSSKLYSLIGKVCNGFDPMALLNQQRAKTSDGHDTVLPPQDKALCVGFVFRLLFILDSQRDKTGGDQILKDFLMQYYNPNDLNASIAEFGNLLKSFKENAVQLLSA
ncbi:MAG: hypothetical protein LBU60_05705 [Clostridiales bacterium]|jgi:hypothetical protein|nr:hypothetical protein [Clostridiales bacterium]